MKTVSTALVDQHLQSLHGMQEVATGEFFYTRLKARMEQTGSNGWGLPLRPVWVIGTLVLFLAMNSIMLRAIFKSKKETGTSASSIQKFAEAYDQNIVAY